MRYVRDDVKYFDSHENPIALSISIVEEQRSTTAHTKDMITRGQGLIRG